jgi:hypothetical protein
MKIFGVISHYSSRIRTFSLTLDTPYSFPNVKIQGSLPLLTKLDVNIIRERDRPVFDDCLQRCTSSSRGAASGCIYQWISLPWIQSTHLEFYDETVSSCMQILNQHRISRFWTLEVFPASAAQPELLRPLTLLRLHTLRFTFDPNGWLFTCLILPALKTVHLASLGGNSPSRFLALGARSAWSVQSRSIYLEDTKAADCTTCLGLFLLSWKSRWTFHGTS